MARFVQPSKAMSRSSGNRKVQGFTAIEIMIVVLILGILVGAATPSFLRARQSSQTKMCLSNLYELDAATDQWAMEQMKVGTDVPVRADLQPYLKSWPTCPSGGVYVLHSVDEAPTCTSGGSHSF